MKTKTLLFLFVVLMCLNSSVLTAQWESTGFTKATWALAKAENGNLIAADDMYPELGGIYLSQDQGDSWVKTSATDYAYTAHVVKDESIYMGGVEGNVAISHDNGETWANVNFGNVLPGLTVDDPIYAMEYHNGRIYASVFNFGVVYSEDEGVTWNLTDQESLWDVDNPIDGGQWTYNLHSYHDQLYNIGAFGIWVYDETADLWAQVDDRWYGNSSLIVDDVFYVIYNADGIPDGIRYTTDFQNWEVMPLPDGASTSVRFMEYYHGAFFMGHVSEAILYTVDQGATWIEYREDFPAFEPIPGLNLYGTPMNLVFDGETMYCGVFSPIDGVGGVFKAPVPAELNINEISASLQPVLYPNPAKDFVMLQFPQDQENQGSLRITDALGRVQYNKTIGNEENNTISVSTETWASGVYLYSIVTEGSKASGKFIVE
ncbi:T9SS type A sorting domain-containing protein [Aequorivita capsosiphonis]|uniref:T9SS type A sorting domain-containing protein n=1 Tax=Aequorivita capsosiphonis TaxID=487317 RepID=UPI0004215615|nr:T9SS type A sorting domain-containing protein [Aequorivita capsosiphonis]